MTTSAADATLMTMDELWTFTLADVAERLRISTRAVKRLIASGQLEAVRLAGSYCVTARQLQALLEARTGVHRSKRPTAHSRMPQHTPARGRQ